MIVSNQGTIEVTGLDLDLAIQGEALPNGGGFFEVTDPVTGELFYTRAGAFEATNQGFVVTRDQYRYQLQGVDNALTVAVPETQTLLARRVEEDGVINLVVHDSAQKKDIVTSSAAPYSRLIATPLYIIIVGKSYVARIDF